MTFLNTCLFLISLLPSVLLGEEESGGNVRIRKKMRTTKKDKEERLDAGEERNTEKGGRRGAVRSWILALISLVRLDCKTVTNRRGRESIS